MSPSEKPAQRPATNLPSFMQTRNLTASFLITGLVGMALLLPSLQAAEGPASVTTSPLGRTVLQSSATTFTVTADGTAPLSYFWRKDGAVIAGPTGSSYTINS